MKKYYWILLTLATLIVFLPTVGTYFSQDDWVFLSHVYKQPFLSVWKHYSEAFYRPVGQQLFFFLGSRLFGLEPQGFHLIGLVIHVFNIWLLSKLLNIWNCDRRLKYFLLTFYAVNPAHFVALNWLTQMDIEIAVGFGLLTILFWKKTIFSLGFFLAALLSHETVVMLPIAMAFWISKGPTSGGRTLIKPVTFFGLGVLVLVTKFLINPFSLQSDYSLDFNLLQLLSTLKWYGLRALAIPEGIRSLPVWLIILSLIPGLILILIFRQKLIRGLGIYLLGVLPVLGFGSHLLAAYAVFGIALMVIELGRKSVIPAKAGIYLDRFRITPGMTMLLVIVLPAAIFIYSNVSRHWSVSRGMLSWGLTQRYVEADSSGKKEILQVSADFVNNPEIYFSAMAGKQFEVLDRGVNRGLFDSLFYRGNDMTTQFLPDAEFFKDRILAGKFPMWNPWIMAGMPYFLDPQNFLWYPPNYIFLLVPVEAGFLILLVGHLGLVGWGVKKILAPPILTSGLLGTIRTRPEERLVGGLDVPADFSGEKSGSVQRILALFGAMMFVLSPKLVGHIEEGNWTLVIAACWLPILYLALKKNKFWWTVISLSAIIINNLNIGYYSVLFVLFYFLTYASLKSKILIVTAVLTIPRWLPLLMWGGQTVRANLQEVPLPLWSWMKIAKSLFFPLAAGHPVLQNEEILYLGIIPMGLVLLGILGEFVLYKGLTLPRQGRALLRKGDSLFWFVWLTFIFLVALNNKTPLLYVINKLPGFSLLRITTRPWIFAALAVALAVPMAIRRIGPHTNLTSALGLRPSSRRAMVRGSDVPADFLAKIRARPKNWGLLVESILVLLILSEFIWFDWKIFERREMVSDQAPARFYRQMAAEGTLVRAYCTTGCLDRLTAQRMGIALLGGNNPIQLKSYVEYLQGAGGYREQGYHPILPPYTVFNQQPQPGAELLAKTATKFVVSPYELTDENFKLVDQQGDFRLYQNTAESQDMKDHYFELETIKML